MSLDRATVDALMVRRLGYTLTFWNLDGTTVDGSNPDVGAALGRALLDVGVSPSSLTAPADDDLSTMTGADDQNRVLDLTHLFLLEACLDNAAEVREREGVNEQEWNGRIAELRRRLDQKRSQVIARHGDGLGTVSGGTLTLSFLQPDPDDDEDDD